MHYPEHLKQAVLAKAKDLPLEGFVEGQGPQQPKVMLIGEAPGKEEIKENVPFIGAFRSIVDGTITTSWLKS